MSTESLPFLKRPVLRRWPRQLSRSPQSRRLPRPSSARLPLPSPRLLVSPSPQSTRTFKLKPTSSYHLPWHRRRPACRPSRHWRRPSLRGLPSQSTHRTAPTLTAPTRIATAPTPMGFISVSPTRRMAHRMARCRDLETNRRQAGRSLPLRC
jgi:hypothetical protein